MASGIERWSVHRPHVLLLGAALLVSCDRRATEAAPQSADRSAEPSAKTPVAVEEPQALPDVGNREDATESAQPMFDYDGMSDLDEDKTYIIVVQSSACPASNSLTKSIASMADLSVEVVFVGIEHVTAQPVFSTPWMWLYDGGRVVDASNGAALEPNPKWREVNHGHVRHLLSRNGMGGIERPDLYTPHPSIEAERGVQYGSAQNLDLRHLDMDGYDFEGANLSGTVFDGSSFVHASFNKTIAFNASFVGADFSGTALDDVYWSNVVCPDGSLSDTHGFTCEVR